MKQFCAGLIVGGLVASGLVTAASATKFHGYYTTQDLLVRLSDDNTSDSTDEALKWMTGSGYVAGASDAYQAVFEYTASTDNTYEQDIAVLRKLYTCLEPPDRHTLGDTIDNVRLSLRHDAGKRDHNAAARMLFTACGYID